MTNPLIKITALLLILAAMVAAEDDSAKADSLAKADTLAMQKHYSFRAGFNTSSIGSFRSGFGFQIGGAADIPLSRIDLSGQTFYLGIEPSAFFVTKSGKAGYLIGGSSTIDAYYVEAPVPVTFKKVFSQSVSGHLDFGPYLALGLFGTYERKYSNLFYVPNVSGSTSAFDYLSRFDAGIYYGAGVDIQKKYFLGIHFSSGFTEGSIYSFYMNAGYNF
jgi:hypothetical protein